MSRAWMWGVLGIARTRDTGAIRRAYAERLKALDIDREAEAYEDLRSARDAALAWARAQADKPEPDPLPPVDEVPAAAPDTVWPYAAPVLDRPESDGGLRIPAPPELHPRLRDLSPERAQRGELRDLAAAGTPVFAVPLIAPGDAPDEAMVRTEGAYDLALHELLYAGGEGDETPLTGAEADAALRWQRLILRDAAQASLSAHDSIETWLAERLAGAWPRSAPLLAEASDAFGWGREAGQLGERPAIAYLNARLKGLHFLERVQLPSHPLHRAWTELRRPGRTTWFGRLRQSRDDIHRLLAGIRKNFPELEHYLDPQRVASWEPKTGGSERRWGYSWKRGLLAVVALQILLAIGRCATSQEPRPPLTYESEIANSDALRAQMTEAVHEIFGADTGYLELTRLEPELARTIQANLSYSAGEADGAAKAMRRAIEVVRARMYLAARLGDDAALRERVMRLRLRQMQAARKVDAAACMLLLRSNTLDPRVTLPEDLRRDERLLARSMLIDDKLDLPVQKSPPGKRQASIPGKVIERIMRETGFGEAKVAELLQGKGSNDELCAMTTALLGAALDMRGSTGDAILRVL